MSSSAQQCGTFEMGVIALGTGIILYFAWPVEPNLTLCLGVLTGLSLFWGWLRGHGSGQGGSQGDVFFARIQGYTFLLIALMIGFVRATGHAAALDYPVLPASEQSYDVTGWIEGVEKSGPRLRWVVRPASMSRWGSSFDKAEMPHLIRVSTHDKTFRPGQSVSFTARLSAPPGPAIPGGYDPARRAFFAGIGGYGYMISKPSAAQLAAPSGAEAMRLKIARWRYHVARRIQAKAPEATSGLQVALLTGIRAFVPDDQTGALRAAGLAHVLAISGLHMGFTAGAAYYLAALFLALIQPLSRRYDMRKYAAVIGIIIATAYLVLSGASVATQRAYIMTLIVFTALILNRRALSLRSVALAAVITLMLHPEALISPGFQMSFAAVAALIIVYQIWDNLREFTPRRGGRLARLRRSFVSLSVTSFVAGTATSGYALLHFNRVASYGLIGNLIAMPVFTFWVMPSAFLVFLALPFGLEGPALWLMGRGLDVIVRISMWVESWPGSVGHIAALPGSVAALYSAAFLALCLAARLRVRAAALAVMTLCLSLAFILPTADMRISASGSVALFQAERQTENGDESPQLIVDNLRRDRFGRERFAQSTGEVDIPVIDFSAAETVSCDSLGCRIVLRGKPIMLVYDPTEIAQDCASAQLIILPKRKLGARAKRLCRAKIIDASDLSKGGAHTITIGRDGEIKLRRALTRSQNRPWRART